MKRLALPVSAGRRAKWAAKPPFGRVGSRICVNFNLDTPLNGDKSPRYRGIYCLGFLGPNYGDRQVEMFPKKGTNSLVSPQDANLFISTLASTGMLPSEISFTAKEDKVISLTIPRGSDHRRNYVALCVARWILNRPNLVWAFLEAFKLEKRVSVYQALCYAVARFEGNLDKSFVGYEHPYEDLDSLQQPLMPLALKVFFSPKHPLKKFLRLGHYQSALDTNDLIHGLSVNISGLGGETYALEDPKDYLSPKLGPSLDLRNRREVKAFLKQNFTKTIGKDDVHHYGW